jgi:hypothetical protein
MNPTPESAHNGAANGDPMDWAAPLPLGGRSTRGLCGSCAKHVNIFLTELFKNTQLFVDVIINDVGSSIRFGVDGPLLLLPFESCVLSSYCRLLPLVIRREPVERIAIGD